MSVNSIRAALALLIACLCVGCGAGGGGTEVASNAALVVANLDTSDELFLADELLQVDIEMAPADYAVLQLEGRSLPQVFAGCAADFDYSHFSSTVTVNGERLENVDIRKKGFLGSLSVSRPSFKLNFDALDPDRSFHGLDRLTLNNNRQDPGNAHQCMTYQLFEKAGLVAPRCNFARVSVNGDDLGIYTHVDSIRRPFLRRNFADDLGNLYEAQLADFGDFTKENFQLKTNIDENDRSDLDAVAVALNADDDNMPGLLAQVLDMDEYLSFWAMEGITGHWDSATGNANNYFVYRELSDGKFHYIPWGADGAMESVHSLAPGTGPLFRYTEIAARLYQIPEWRDKYHQRVLDLLDEVWDEQALQGEVDRIRDLTNTSEENLAQVRGFISSREAQVRASVAGEIVQIERTIIDEPTVCTDSNVTSMSGSFANGLGSFEYTDENGELIVVPAFAAAPSLQGAANPLGGGVSMLLIGQHDGETIIAFINIEQGQFGQSVIPFHGVATSLFLIGLGGSDETMVIGLSGGGDINFTQTPELDQPASFEFVTELWFTDGDNFGPFGGNP